MHLARLGHSSDDFHIHSRRSSAAAGPISAQKYFLVIVSPAEEAEAGVHGKRELLKSPGEFNLPSGWEAFLQNLLDPDVRHRVRLECIVAAGYICEIGRHSRCRNLASGSSHWQDDEIPGSPFVEALGIGDS